MYPGSCLDRLEPHELSTKGYGLREIQPYENPRRHGCGDTWILEYSDTSIQGDINLWMQIYKDLLAVTHNGPSKFAKM